MANESTRPVFVVPASGIPTIHIVDDSGNSVVSISRTGVVLGDGYTPDEAAKRFWDALQKHIAGFDPQDVARRCAEIAERGMTSGQSLTGFGIAADIRKEFGIE